MYWETNMELVKYGFSLYDLKNVPIDEYHYYVKLFNKKQAERQQAANAGNGVIHEDL